MGGTPRAAWLLLMLVGAARNGMTEGPEVGQRAPRIEISEWLSGELKGPGALAGKTVLLEFWATWCGPCRQMIPHMNELVTKYSSSEIVFVSMSDENRDRVMSFMGKLPMKARVVLDSKQQTNRSYGIETIPYMYIIDGSGIVKWRGHPGMLQEETLADLLRGQPPAPSPAAAAQPAPPAPAPVATPAAPSANIQLLVRNSDHGTAPTRSVTQDSDQTEIRVTGQPVARIIASLLHYPVTQVRLRCSVSAQPVDVLCLALPSMSPADAERQTAETLCKNIGVTTSRVTERCTCRILKAAGPHTPPPHSSVMKTTTTGGVWKATAASMSDVAGFLGGTFGVLTVDDTHLTGSYDFSIPSDDYAKARKSLEDTYGIRIEEGARNVEFLVLSRGK